MQDHSLCNFKLNIPKLKFEDIYVGMLASKLNTNMIHIGNLYLTHFKERIVFENLTEYESYLFCFLDNFF